MRFVFGLIIFMLTVLPLAAEAASFPPLFTTEIKAHNHCPDDTVVWLNLPSGIYHFKGQRWYGRTHSGACVCEHEADQAGDRATRNGE